MTPKRSATAAIEKRIERQDFLHAEAADQFDQRAADAAHADDAQRAIAQLAAHVAGAVVPAAFAHQPILGAHLVRQGQHPAERGLGHRAIDRADGGHQATSAAVQAATSTES